MLEIENTGIDIQHAALVVGLSETEIRSLINRERLLTEMHRRQGIALSFSIQHLFILAAVKALIDTGFTIRVACDAIRHYSVYASLLEGNEFFLSVNKEGRLVGIDGPDYPVSIRIRPWALAKDMRPGLIAAFGEDAVAEWDAALEKLHAD